MQVALRRVTQRWRRLLVGRWWVHHSLPRRRARWRIFCFVCSAVTQDISKRVVSLVSGSQEQYSSEPCITGSLPSPAGSSGLPKSTSPAHSWNQVRAVALESPLQVVTRRAVTSRAVTSLKPGSCVPPAQGGIRWVLHCTPRPRPLPSQARPSQVPGWVPVFHLAAPSRVRQSLVSPPQPASVAPADHQTQLCDSVRPAFPQVQGHPVHFNQGGRCPCLACGNRSPAAKDAKELFPPADMRSGFVSPYFIVPKKSGGLWPILDLWVLIRAPQKLPFKMLTQKCIFLCVRPLH